MINDFSGLKKLIADGNLKILLEAEAHEKQQESSSEGDSGGSERGDGDLISGAKRILDDYHSGPITVIGNEQGISELYERAQKLSREVHGGHSED